MIFNIEIGHIKVVQSVFTFFKFKSNVIDMYYFDMTNYNIENHKTKFTINNYSSQDTNNFCLLNTIEQNKSLYPKKQVKKKRI